MNYVYIVLCSDATLYTGWTTNLEKRIQSHNNKKGAKYTKARTPVKLVYHECLPDKSSALKREYEIKRMTKSEKQHLIDKE